MRQIHQHDVLYFQTVWLIVTGYTNNLLAFDLCGTSENKAKALVNMNVSSYFVDLVHTSLYSFSSFVIRIIQITRQFLEIKQIVL